MNIQFVRHATCLININNKRILLDPMLSDVGMLPPVPLSTRKLRNPMIPLPFGKEKLLQNMDAILLSHNHFDHFDKEAINVIPKDTLILCQPGDNKYLKAKGFVNVQVINKTFTWDAITFSQFPANHGKGYLLKKAMGRSSSYFIQTGEESLFITGDAVFDPLLRKSLEETKPGLIIANLGAATFRWGKPITMDFDGLKQIKQLLPDAKIITVHMDAINHCLLSKENLKENLAQESWASDINIPNEGDMLEFD